MRKVSCTAALVALVVAAGAADARTAGAVTFADGHGLHVVAAKQVDERVVALQLTTAALAKPVGVDVMLPPGYDDRPNRRYPVLWLFHGSSGAGADWVTDVGVKSIIGTRPMIVVMPDETADRGASGWCTNWAGGDAAARWETFHVDELVPWIDGNLRTIPTRGERAIAGISEGGFCSMTYAARHPDLFATALAFSGVVETWQDPAVRAGAMGIVNLFEVEDGLPPDTVFGNPATDAINWAAHDPGALATNLRATRLHMFWGDGRPGPFDTATTYPSSNIAGEALANVDNEAFERRLDALGIPAEYDAYGAGTHSMPYWQRDLSQSIDEIQHAFDNPRPDPQRFSYVSGDKDYTVYRWTVAMRGAPRALSTLRAHGHRRFTLTGRGAATVTTPPAYRPHRRYRVRVAGDQAALTTNVVRADRAGRLRVEVPLGAASVGGSPPTTTVSIARG